MNKSKHIQPPGFADRMLETFCTPQLLEEIQGDLLEMYGKWDHQYGRNKANRLYVLHAIKFLRPAHLKKIEIINPTDMFKNYFTIAIRNISKHKSFAAINIAGLTLGITCALVIFLLVRFELSFDTFHSKGDRIYRVLKGSPGEVTDTGTPTGLMPVMEEEFAEVEQVAVAFKENPENTQIEVNNELSRVQDICYVTPSFYQMFEFEWIVGSPEKSLSEPGQVVIDEELAQQYFQGDAMGKRIKLNNSIDLVVTGIMANPPKNTDMPIEMAVSYATYQRSEGYQPEYENSSNSYHQTFVLLQKGADPAVVDAKFYEMIKKYLGQENADKYTAHALQPLQDVHFNTDVANNFSQRIMSKKWIKSLGLIGLFLIITACINFVNLSTAQSVKRSKEVGVRKLLGSTRGQMVGQFMSETLSLTVLAMVLSYLLASVLFSYLPALLGISLDPSLLYQPQMVLLTLGIVVLVSLLAGYYPALVLSNFKPISTIKNTFTNKQTGGLILRKGLIVFQFALSQVLIICTIVVLNQMHYFNNTALGFDKEAIVTVDFPGGNANKLQAIKNNLSQSADIKAVSFSLNTPAATINKWWTNYIYQENPEVSNTSEMKIIDSDYLELYDIPLLAGRNVMENDSAEVLVNEAFLVENEIEKPEEALGKTMKFYGMERTIVGVVKNFHSLSLGSEIPTVTLLLAPSFFQKASIKINMSHAKEAITAIEQQWHEAFPDYFFTYKFLDDDLATLYESEQRTSRLLTIFACIAIFIGCLGLYGLISFLTIQKMKEVGIRKVLGATASQIVYLFTKDFALLIMIAFVIAAPIGYYLMRQWLADYTYKIDISWWMFALAIVAGLLIAGFTISFKSIKAALANPVDSLRNE